MIQDGKKTKMMGQEVIPGPVILAQVGNQIVGVGVAVVGIEVVLDKETSRKTVGNLEILSQGHQTIQGMTLTADSMRIG